MKKYIFISLAAVAIATVSCSDEKVKMPWEDDLNKKHQEEQNKPETPGFVQAEEGKTLPAWSEGCLDIHLINSGRGECLFHILPDGTTLLVDAGETSTSDTSVPQRPDDKTRPYITDANYIKHFLPEGKTSIDWCAPSHFHIDHIGEPAMATETSPNGYKLAGLLALYDEVPFEHVLDMGYPNYNDDPDIPDMDGGLYQDWIKFVNWGVQASKFSADRFRTGEEQITLLNKAADYANFKIFNICANGYVWKIDSETGATSIVNSKASKGNPASCGFHLTYGKFDYITCGDLTSTPQNHVANYVAAAIPAGGFELFKGHHHLSSNSWGSGMQKTAFSPRVIVNQNFSNYQPDSGLLTSVFSGEFANNTYVWAKDVFTTNGHPDLVSANQSLWNNVAGYNGHIVVRVLPGGDEFYVYMLDDTNFDYKVKSIHGPYKSN